MIKWYDISCATLYFKLFWLQNGQFCLLRREFQQYLMKQDQEQLFFIEVLSTKRKLTGNGFPHTLEAFLKVKSFELLTKESEIYWNSLTFWRRSLFQILAHPVFKMWVIQKPNKVALWNKRHFEGKKWRLYSMIKILSMDICWINIKWGI